MDTVNIYEARTQLSRIVARVEAGETVVLARDGKPVARIVPYALEPRTLGSARGEFRVGDDFDAPLPDDM